MISLEIAILSLFAVFFVWMFLCALKNDATYRVRTAFIFSDRYPHDYNKLPSYEAMVWNPRHLLRWTEKSWREYVASR